MAPTNLPNENRLTVSNLFFLTAIVAALAVSLDAGALIARLSEVTYGSKVVLIPISLLVLVGVAVGGAVGYLRSRSLLGALFGLGAGWLASIYLLALFTAPASSERLASGVMISCLAPLIIRSTLD